MKTHKLPKRSRRSRRAALTTCAFLAGASAALFAQDAENEEVFTLSPFEVNAADDRGYRATNTLAGTRFDSSLKDTPASVSVFTLDFIEDAGLDSVRDAMEYTMAFNTDNRQDNGNHEQFGPGDIVARGFSLGQGTSRDFFKSETAQDRYNVERMEFSRGPNSVLFGIGNPGGIINAITKRARPNRTFGQVELQADEYGSQRYSFDYNKAIVEGKFAMRLNFLYRDKLSYRDIEFDETMRANLAFTWKVAENTTFRAGYEDGTTDKVSQRRWVARDGVSKWESFGSQTVDFNDFANDEGDIDFNAARNFARSVGGDSNRNTTPGVIDNGVTREYRDLRWTTHSTAFRDDILTTFDVWDIEHALAGTTNTTNHDFYNYSAFLEQKIGDKLYIELAFKKEHEDRDVVGILNHGDIEPRVDIAQYLPDGSVNPNFGDYYIESRPQWNPFFKDFETKRVTASYVIDPENKWLGRHQLAALWEEENYNQQFNRYRYTNRTPLDPNRLRIDQNRITGRTYISNIRGGDLPTAYQFDPFTNPLEPFQLHDAVTGEVIGTVTGDWARDRARPNTRDITSKMIAGQSFFFQDSLVFTWGLRKDDLTQRNYRETKADTAYAQANPGIMQDEILDFGLADPESFDGDTKTFGLAYKPTNWLTFTANESENFQPQTRFNVYNENIGHVTATGEDYSVRFDLFENRVYLVANYFETVVDNQTSSNFSTINRANSIWSTLNMTDMLVEENGVKGKSSTGSGWEYELVANPTPNITLRANYTNRDNLVTEVNPFVTAYIAEHRSLWLQNADTPILNDETQTIGDVVALMEASNADDQLQLGSLPDNFIAERAGLFGKYEFLDGPLEGFDFGGGVRHYGKRKTGIISGVLDFTDPYQVVDLKFGYKFRLKNENQVKLRLNVKNAFEQGTIQITRRRSTGEVRSFQLIDPRSLILSATYNF